MWRRWWTFTAYERRQLLLLCCSLCWIRVRLRFTRLDEVISWAEAGGNLSSDSTNSAESRVDRLDTDSQRSDAINSLLGSVCRFQGLDNACLPRAIVLCRWLNREGIPGRVKIGVSKRAPNAMVNNTDDQGKEEPSRVQASISAHAWVEVEGYSSDRTIENFSQFPNLQARDSNPCLSSDH